MELFSDAASETNDASAPDSALQNYRVTMNAQHGQGSESLADEAAKMGLGTHKFLPTPTPTPTPKIVPASELNCKRKPKLMTSKPQPTSRTLEKRLATGHYVVSRKDVDAGPLDRAVVDKMSATLEAARKETSEQTGDQFGPLSDAFVLCLGPGDSVEYVSLTDFCAEERYKDYAFDRTVTVLNYPVVLSMLIMYDTPCLAARLHYKGIGSAVYVAGITVLVVSSHY